MTIVIMIITIIMITFDSLGLLLLVKATDEDFELGSLLQILIGNITLPTHTHTHTHTRTRANKK